MIIGLETALAIYKLIQKHWTKGLALCTTAFELIVIIVFSMILTHPNVFNREFILYMSDLLSVEATQFETGLVGGGIALLILVAVLNIYEGYRKSRL